MVESWTITLTTTARAMIAPRERIGGAAWAERERWIGTDEGSPLPGLWRSVPWQREIMDALADPSVQWLTILKGTQVGISEVVRNAVGRWAIHDPGDVLWVMSTQAAAERAMVKLRKMFQNTPALRGLLSDRRSDTTLLELVLTNGMRIVIGWAGSAASLASDPFPRVILDEVALYKWSTQHAGSPVHLAGDRTKTAGRRGKVVLLSSPTAEDDPICTAHRETADRRVFAVPCPTCGLLQPWEWERVTWAGGSTNTAPSDPEARLAMAEVVRREQSAWMACEAPGCAGRIEPRTAMRDPAARWVQEERCATSERRAYHVPEAWHWETTLSDLVAKFLRATSPAALGTFFTGSLGRVLVTAHATFGARLFAARAVHPRTVPAWATVVISTADTQLGGWWLMVRAWGKGGRSRLLDWGFVQTEEELVARGLVAGFAVEGGADLEARPFRLAVDTGGGMRQVTAEDADGSRTKQVYALVRRTRGMVALKGEGDKAATDGAHHRLAKVDGLDVHLLNRNFYADELSRLLQADKPVLWEECVGADDPTYTRQMSSEQKVLETSAKGSKWLWKKKTAAAPNHLWDCARYQVWLADHVQAERRSPSWAARAQTQVVARRPRQVTTEDDGWLTPE